jgi:uncharacterized membrane protein YidH (DUF202 family)
MKPENPPSETNKFRVDSLAMNEARLILAEKRTSLSTLRTGIAVFALPLSVLSILVATSSYYNIFKVMHLLAPLLILTLGMVVLGIYLITRAVLKIRHYDQILLKLKNQNASLTGLIG